MKKIAMIAISAALAATSSMAMAEENLETTGNRNAPLAAYSDVLLAQRGSVRHHEIRRHYNQAPVNAPLNAPQAAPQQTDTNPGLGG